MNFCHLINTHCNPTPTHSIVYLIMRIAMIFFFCKIVNSAMTELQQCNTMNTKLHSLVDAPPGCVSYPRKGDSLPKTSPEHPAGNSHHSMEPSGAGNGVVVAVTYPVDRPLSSSSLQLASSDIITPPDPFSSEKGLSCLSLEVMTSGEHLNTLSLEDLSSRGSGEDADIDLEGEELAMCVDGDQKGEEFEKGSGGDVEELKEREECSKDVTAIVEGW